MKMLTFQQVLTREAGFLAAFRGDDDAVGR